MWFYVSTVIMSTVKITFNLIIHLCVVSHSSFVEPHFAKITHRTKNITQQLYKLQ